MFQYTIQRILLAIPTLLGITLLTFLIMRLAPGDPVDLFLGGAASGEGISTDHQADMGKTRRDLRRQLGLDQPLHLQYLHWLSNLVLRVEDLDAFDRGALLADAVLDELPEAARAELASLEGAERKVRFLEHLRRRRPERVNELVESPFWQSRLFSPSKNYAYAGSGLELVQADGWRLVTLNLGRSFKDQEPVIDHILDRLPVTLEINLISLVFAYLVGVPLGIVVAVKHNTAIDRLATTGTFMLWSMPPFWIGMLLILFFLLIQVQLFIYNPRYNCTIARNVAV